MSCAAAPLGPGDVAPAFDALLSERPHVALAVSGGSDSMALLHLVAEWRAARGPAAPSLSVVTVDHALRAESRSEADQVGAVAHRLGLEHTVLTWAGPKPATGLQMAAREARYRLVAEHMAARGWRSLATAHTEDDQAETLLMRLARGSGLDGLAAMRPVSEHHGLEILRPLLGVPKSRLRATLAARGLAWIEDPSNDNPAFERVRLRSAMPHLAGLGLTGRALAASARRLARAGEALEATTLQAMRTAGRRELRIDPLGFAELSWSWLLGRPPEIRLRVLSRLIEGLGGTGAPPSLARLEALTDGEGWACPAGRTLGGVVLEGDRDDRLVLTRESGRRPIPAVPLPPGARIVWDQRFEIAAAETAPQGLVVAALGREGLAELSAQAQAPAAPLRAVLTQPAVRLGDALLAVPMMDYVDAGAAEGLLACRLRLLERLS